MSNNKPLSNRAAGYDSIQAEMALRQRNAMNLAVGAMIPNFSTETGANQGLQIKIVNNADTDKVICLFPGDLPTKQEISDVLGVTVDAIAVEGTTIPVNGAVGAVLVTTQEGTTMGYSQRFMKSNPTRWTRIQFKSNLEEQMDEALVFAHSNPFEKVGVKKINPGLYGKETNQNAKMITVSPNDIQIDDQTVVFIKVLAGATLQLNVLIGACSNRAAVLASQAKTAFSGK